MKIQRLFRCSFNRTYERGVYHKIERDFFKRTPKDACDEDFNHYQEEFLKTHRRGIAPSVSKGLEGGRVDA